MSDIEYSIAEGIGRIALNRPQAINALTSDMIDSLDRALRAWAEDPRVERVEIRGIGRGFCAGADVRQAREYALENPARAVDFLDREYALDALVAHYPKPYTAHMTGIVMGGGMGLSVHGTHRVVDETTRMSMPETIIGLWPDVGVMYHLARIPGEVGTYMALTGLPITGRQGLAYGLADEFSSNARGTEEDSPQWDSTTDSWMPEAFSGDDPVEIVTRLEAATDDLAHEAALALRARSPLSVCVALEAVRRAATMTVDEVFEQDLRLGTWLMAHSDFAEGVRAQLIDKDHCPQWSHRCIEDVSQEEVLAVFGE